MDSRTYSSLLCAFLIVSRAADVISSDYEDDSQHPCARECQDGGAPMVCQYDFTVEWYYVLSKACQDCPLNHTHCDMPECIAADGVPRAITVVNRRMPGPGIFVCQDDVISVTVRNKMVTSDVVTIHWHGVSQRGTQYMDGVPMITQCPIHPYSSFKYYFKAEESGSHLWHAHSGFHRADGVIGPLVVRQPRSQDPQGHLYDLDLTEHYITLTEWLGELTVNKFERHHHQHGDTMPQSMLINGKGAFEGYHNHATNEHVYTPYAFFYVTPGKRHRFRMTSNGIVDCPIQFSIDDHNLTVIATDGNPVEPRVIESLVILSGERYDFVLHARSDSSVGNFWIRTAGLTNCAGKKASQLAVLRYDGAPNELPSGPTDYKSMVRETKQLNPTDVNVENHKDRLISVAQLNSLVPDDATSQLNADVTFYLVMDYSSMHAMKHGDHDQNMNPKSQMGHSGHGMTNNSSREGHVGKQVNGSQEMDHSNHSRMTNKENGHHMGGEPNSMQNMGSMSDGGNMAATGGSQGNGEHEGHSMGIESTTEYSTGVTKPISVDQRGRRDTEDSTVGLAGHNDWHNGESNSNLDNGTLPGSHTSDPDPSTTSGENGHSMDSSNSGVQRTPNTGQGMRPPGHMVNARGGGIMAHSSMEHPTVNYDILRNSTEGNTRTDEPGTGHTNMDHSNMDHSNMDNSNMGVSNMDHSNMDHSNMGGSNMDHSNMDHSNMGRSNMDHSNMDHSNMDHSNMGGSNMDHSNMDHSNMGGSNMDHSNMGHQAMDSSGHHIHSPQINQITMTFPPKPLLSQFNEIPKEQFCNHTTHTECDHGACECTYLLEVELGQVVELVLVDLMGTKDSHHPMHLHGQSFRVMAMQKIDKPFTADDIKQMDKDGLIQRKLKGPAVKDTVAVPNGGFTIIRFHATNPGFWLFHCHLLIHSESGMSLVIKVGDPKKDFPPVPHNFPRCGTWNFENEEKQMTTAKCSDGVPRVQRASSHSNRITSNSLFSIVGIFWFLAFSSCNI